MYKRIAEFPDNIDELAMPELAALSYRSGKFGGKSEIALSSGDE